MLEIKRWAASLIVEAIITVSGCGSQVVETTPPKPPLKFDSRNPEITFRWLIEQAAPLRASGRLSSDEQSNNPLRKDHYNADQKNRQAWAELINGLVGQRVIWPVVVQQITTEGVEVDCDPKTLHEDEIDTHVHFAEYSHRANDRFDGKLLIGSTISLEQAKSLDRGSRLAVQGMIEKIEHSIGPYNSNYLSIYIEHTKAIMP